MTKIVRLFVALLISIIFIGIGDEVANAKADKEIKTKLVNKKVNSNTSEAIVEVKNKKDKDVSIARIVLKKKQENQVELKTKEENWVEMKRTNKKYKVKAHTKKYIDVDIKGVSAGEYKMIFYIKKGTQVIKKCVGFGVKNINNQPDSSKEPQVLPVEEETTDCYVPAPSVQPAVIKNNVAERKNSYNAKQILLNGDFRINAKGKVEAVIFSETYYKTAYKTKIDLRIQRRTKKGFKTYKRYKQIKKSNIAFLNKNFKIKKSGQYRMYVKIISYKRKNKKSIRYYKSKTVTYRK